VIGGAPCVEARVSLLSVDLGGLQVPLPSATRSLLLNFSSLSEQDGTVQIGAVIDRLDGRALEPGAVDVPVRLRFWAGEAAVYATPGTTFQLWYGGVVGDGVVDRIVDEVADAAS
jgi:hypothetical protein